MDSEYKNYIYNLGFGRGTSINEIFSNLKTITEYELPAVNGPAKVGETQRIYLEASRANQDLGWTPTVGLEEGLKKTVDYFKTREAEV
jgi:UDP-glucose 4-epimerase